SVRCPDVSSARRPKGEAPEIPPVLWRPHGHSAAGNRVRKRRESLTRLSIQRPALLCCAVDHGSASQRDARKKRHRFRIRLGELRATLFPLRRTFLWGGGWICRRAG